MLRSFPKTCPDNFTYNILDSGSARPSPHLPHFYPLHNLRTYGGEAYNYLHFRAYKMYRKLSRGHNWLFHCPWLGLACSFISFIICESESFISFIICEREILCSGRGTLACAPLQLMGRLIPCSLSIFPLASLSSFWPASYLQPFSMSARHQFAFSCSSTVLQNCLQTLLSPPSNK